MLAVAVWPERRTSRRAGITCLNSPGTVDADYRGEIRVILVNLGQSIPDGVDRFTRVFEIVFLGTSASAPSVHRGLSSQVVIHDEFRFLIDCGEGTQRQILQSGLGFKRLNRVLITHGHLDHILGLAGLLSTFMRWETIDKLEIMGGQWALDRIYDLIYGIVLRGAKPPMDLQLVQIKPGIILDEDDFTVTAFPVWHRGPDCFGYVFQEYVGVILKGIS